MIHKTNKSLFSMKTDCLVNAVNCVGNSTQGTALEFAIRYPAFDKLYKKECKKKLIKMGQVYFYDFSDYKILSFPVRYHKNDEIILEDIHNAFMDFKKHYKEWNIKSIAFPAFDVNQMGLKSEEIAEVIYKDLMDVDIDIYICKGTEVDEEEENMLIALKSIPLVKLGNELNLSFKTIYSIKFEIENLKRFTDLKNIKNISATAYKKIYLYLRDKKYCDALGIYNN